MVVSSPKSIITSIFFEYIKKCGAAGITIPIIPGVIPVYTVKMTQMLSKVCGTAIPDEMQSKLDQLDQDDKEAVLNFGIDFAVRQCQGLLDGGGAGLHFYTMDCSKLTAEIITRLQG